MKERETLRELRHNIFAAAWMLGTVMLAAWVFAGIWS